MNLNEPFGVKYAETHPNECSNLILPFHLNLYPNLYREIVHRFEDKLSLAFYYRGIQEDISSAPG